MAWIPPPQKNLCDSARWVVGTWKPSLNDGYTWMPCRDESDALPSRTTYAARTLFRPGQSSAPHPYFHEPSSPHGLKCVPQFFPYFSVFRLRTGGHTFSSRLQSFQGMKRPEIPLRYETQEGVGCGVCHIQWPRSCPVITSNDRTQTPGTWGGQTGTRPRRSGPSRHPGGRRMVSALGGAGVWSRLAGKLGRNPSPLRPREGAEFGSCPGDGPALVREMSSPDRQVSDSRQSGGLVNQWRQ